MHVEIGIQGNRPVKRNPTASKTFARSFGEVTSEFIITKQIEVDAGMTTASEFASICSTLEQADKYAASGRTSINSLDGALWKEYSTWRKKQQADIQDATIANERKVISSLFKFAEQKEYITPSSLPKFYKAPTQEQELLRWIKQQPVTWAAFTLKFPRFHNPIIWNRVLFEFFKELEHRYTKSTVRKHRSNAEEPILLRVVYLGGDKESGTVLHSHGLVEVQERGIERLIIDMGKTWCSVVKRHKDSFCRSSDDYKNMSWFPDAKVWVEEFKMPNEMNAAPYVYYMSRNEGLDLGFGVQKVVESATSLKPPRS